MNELTLAQRALAHAREQAARRLEAPAMSLEHLAEFVATLLDVLPDNDPLRLQIAALLERAG